MLVVAAVIVVSLAMILLQRRITAKGSNELGRMLLGADLAQATLLLAVARTPYTRSGELNPATISSLARVSKAATQLANITEHAYAPMSGFARALEAWPAHASQLHNTLDQTLSSAEAINADLAAFLGSQDAFLRGQQELQTEVLEVWRDATGHFLDALRGMLENAQRAESLNEALDEISVVIYLDSDDASTVEQIVRYVDELVELLGYDGPIRPIIEHGSFWRRSLAKIKVAFTSDEVRDLVAKAERVVEVHYLDSEQADVDNKMAEAVSNLIAALADVPTACIRTGSILFIKYSGPQGPVILSKSLTPREVKTLERFPGIQQEPNKVLEYLALAQASLTEP